MGWFPNWENKRIGRLAHPFINITFGKMPVFCINQYELLEEETPALAETNIQLLKQTIKICKDIERRVELLELKSKGTKVELEYLFNWNKIPGPDKIKLDRFMGKEIGITPTPYKISDVKKSKNDNELSCPYCLKTKMVLV